MGMGLLARPCRTGGELRHPGRPGRGVPAPLRAGVPRTDRERSQPDSAAAACGRVLAQLRGRAVPAGRLHRFSRRLARLALSRRSGRASVPFLDRGERLELLRARRLHASDGRQAHPGRRPAPCGAGASRLAGLLPPVRTAGRRVSEQEAAFELSMAGLRGPIRFMFTSGGERDTIAALVRQSGLASYESPTPAILAGLVSEAEGVVVDIGANTGIFTLLAAAASRAVRVCAFEPLAAPRELLRANLAFNPDLAPRIVVDRRALSRVCATLPFFETINDRGFVSTSSSLELGHATEVGNHVRR